MKTVTVRCRLRHADTTVLDVVISQETDGGQIYCTIVAVLSYPLSSADKKEDLFEHKYLSQNMELFASSHNCKICGCFNAFASSTILRK